jgi:hypothetical protein
MSNRLDLRMAVGFLLLAAALSGCTISESKDNKTGEDKNVDIRTPLGSISVHKGESDPKATGLSLYPGAQLKKDTGDHDGGANVNISSSFFGVKVVVLKYQSDDSPDKVLAFYRKDMSRYGKVLDCSGNFNVNFHHRDGNSEVTCNDGSGTGHEYNQELKVGTEQNQRVVAIRPSGSGSEFALVYVRANDEKDTM